jgi:hypothetical protein
MKSPIRVNSYSAGERLQILELCIFNILKRGRRKTGVDHRLEITADLNELLSTKRVSGLGHWGRSNNTSSFPFAQILAHLEETGFIENGNHGLQTSAKGKSYIRQCSKRVRAAASKISNDVLDQIVEAIR